MYRKLLRCFAAVSLFGMGLTGASGATLYSNMFVLGDSLSDVGNLFLATSSPGSPTPPLPQNPPYYNGRFAGSDTSKSRTGA
ncbi:MAG: hypothetical protein GY703_24165 [Gammaproteobacteria bacterium]|nr:hypothetical protein [Gammaproteobacteria bacterium]